MDLRSVLFHYRISSSKTSKLEFYVLPTRLRIAQWITVNIFWRMSCFVQSLLRVKYCIALDKHAHWRNEFMFTEGLLNDTLRGRDERGERYVLFNTNQSVSQAISLKAYCICELHWNQIEFHFHGCSVHIIDYVGNIIKFCPLCAPPPPTIPFAVYFLVNFFSLVSCCPLQVDVYNFDRQTAEITLLTCFNCQQRIYHSLFWQRLLLLSSVTCFPYSIHFASKLLAANIFICHVV